MGKQFTLTEMIKECEDEENSKTTKEEETSPRYGHQEEVS